MTDTFDVSSVLWNDVATDHDAVARRGLVVRAKVALAGSWPFLAAATDEADFNTRLALISDQIEARTPPEVLQEVVAGLRRDWDGLRAQATKVASLRREAALHIEAKEGEESLPQAYVHVHKHAGDSTDDSVYQVDHVAGPTFIHTLGHWADHDEAMGRAREYGLPNGLPIYENGRFVEARLREIFAPDEEFFDQKTGQWIPVNRLANVTVEGGAPFTAAYQPDPDAAWRYHSYPPPQPVPGQGGQPTADGQQGVAYPIGPANNGPDGFPTDFAQGEDRSQVGYANQLTPGTWAVTPGTEWPTRPNAGSPDMTPVYASTTAGRGWYDDDTQDMMNDERSTSDDFNGSDKPYWKCKDCGSGNYSHGSTCNNCGERNAKRGSRTAARQTPKKGERVFVPHFMGEEELDGQKGFHATVLAEPGEHPYKDRSEEHLMRPEQRGGTDFFHYFGSRKQATEGIVPTPGPNPNYFSQGTQGLQGDASFPENPSGNIEPKTDNHVDDVYGGVPPQVSSGSASDGTNDGGGYSRQAKAKSKCSNCNGSGTLGAGTKNQRDCPQCGGSGWTAREASRGRLGFSQGSVRHTAPGGGEHAPYRIVHEDGKYFVENEKGERKEKKGYATKEEARQHQKALYANVPGAAESAKESARRTAGGPWEDYQQGYEHGEAGHGEFDLVGQPSREYSSGHADGRAAYEALPPHERQARDWDRGVAQMQQAEREVAQRPNRAGQGYSRDQDGRRQPHHWGSTNGKIVGLCDHCHAPVRYHDDGGGHLRHLHNGSPKCNDSGTKTAKLMQFLPSKIANGADFFRAVPGAKGECSFCGRDATHSLHQSDGSGHGMHQIGEVCNQHAKQYDEQRVASLFFQAAVLENPTAENPTGRGGDPYRARTSWEGFQTQRPRQQMEGEGGMNSNTPTTAPEPIKTGPNVNSPTPGGDDDDQDSGPRNRDDEDE